MNWVGVISVVVRLVIILLVVYYVYSVLNPGQFYSLSSVDGQPSEPRDIPIAIARRDYLRRYIEFAVRDPPTAPLMRRYVKELYDHNFNVSFFSAPDDDDLEAKLEDPERNARLLAMLESPEYQHALRSSKDQRRLYHQLTLIHDPALDQTMLNRYLVSHPAVVQRQPNLFKVDYT